MEIGEFRFWSNEYRYRRRGGESLFLPLSSHNRQRTTKVPIVTASTWFLVYFVTCMVKKTYRRRRGQFLFLPRSSHNPQRTTKVPLVTASTWFLVYFVTCMVKKQLFETYLFHPAEFQLNIFKVCYNHLIDFTMGNLKVSVE